MEVHGFRFYFTPLTGVLFTFRSRYYCTIGHQGVFSLAGWAPLIHARFHGTGATREFRQRHSSFAYEAVTLYGPPFQAVRLDEYFITPCYIRNCSFGSHDTAHATPAGLHMHGLGCSLFARRYWGNRCFFLFLRVLRWVSSPRSLRHAMDSRAAVGGLLRPVSGSRTSPDQSLLAAPRGFSQLSHVLRRLLVPRHPHMHPS